MMMMMMGYKSTLHSYSYCFPSFHLPTYDKKGHNGLQQTTKLFFCVSIYHCCLPFSLPKYDEKANKCQVAKPFFFCFLYIFHLLGYLSFPSSKIWSTFILIIRTGTNKRVRSKETNATTQKASKRKKTKGTHPLIAPSPPTIKRPSKSH